jgi:hypothetical protein
MKEIKTDNKIILEMNFKFQMKDYKLKLVTKKMWIVTILLIILKLLFSFLGRLPP